MTCIRCGSENTDKDGYLYKQPVGMTTKNYGGVVKFTTYYQTQQVPCCTKCKGGFQFWNFVNKLLILLICFGFTLLGVGILFLVFQVPSEVWSFLLYPGLAIMIASMVLWKYLRGLSSNSRLYMKFDKKSMVFYVRPKDIQEWIFYSEWVESIMKMRAREEMLCPMCSVNKSDSGFCKSCGL